jgi:heterodisulfide reductase subunit A
MKRGVEKGIVIIGSGVGGLKASLEVASRGKRVYLVERSPFFGGEIMQLERQFPTNRCNLCQMLPTTNRVEEGEYCLRRDFYHPLIELMPCAELTSLSGQEGAFKARVRKRSRGVKEELCTGCRQCIEACPETTADEFNGFGQRKAIFLQGPQPVPPIPTIDWEQCTRCGQCISICPTNAVDLQMADEERELAISSVILAPGFDGFDPQVLTQYGYKRWPNVITSIEWERMLSPAGPVVERLRRPSDGKALEKVAILLCVGSRERRWAFCSAACCMFAVKEALVAKELQKDLEVALFYMDLRTFGKGYERYAEQARTKGVRFVRGRVPRFWEDPRTHNLVLSQLEHRHVRKEEFDLCVLAIGQRPPEGSKKLARIVGVDLNEWGFCETVDPGGVETTRPGVYVCGAFSEPKDIPDTIIQATACALEALGRTGGTARKPLTQGAQRPDEEPSIGVALCRCHGEISGSIDMEELKQMIQSRPGVNAIMEFDALCVRDEVKGLSGRIRKRGINRLLIGACSPYWFRRRFLERVGGIDPWLVDGVNLREGVIRAHSHEGVQQKAEAMILIAIEQLRKKEDRPASAVPVKNSALVVGGGIAGLTAAQALAQSGVGVHLVEKKGELGGMLKEMPGLIEGLIKGVEANLLVQVHRRSEVTALNGQGGDFGALIKGVDGEREIGVGAVIVATGAEEYQPREFLYGKSRRVVTQREFKKAVVSREIQMESLRSVVMIQCVGSTRDKEHPWCSRFCCIEALENALMLKGKNPELAIFILFKDMMSYGFRERLYSQARDQGVIFLRYEDKGEIKVQGSDRLKVRLQEVRLDCDLLVLSTGVIPNSGNSSLAETLDLELTEDGFFKEAETKFRPVDALREGIYFCGGAHSPRSWQEVVVQAHAAAERALVLLGQEQLVTPRIVSEVSERRCSGCALCVEACPYGARVFDEERMVAVVKEAFCLGCGQCTSLCPNGAASLRGCREDQIMAMIETAL